MGSIKNTRILMLGLVLVLTACSAGKPAPNATGEEIYDQLCAHCHGADLDGGGGPSLGPGSDSATESDESLEVAIMSGRGGMPSFSSSLDDDQLARLVDYIREVQVE